MNNSIHLFLIIFSFIYFFNFFFVVEFDDYTVRTRCNISNVGAVGILVN